MCPRSNAIRKRPPQADIAETRSSTQLRIVSTGRAPVPEHGSLQELRAAAAHCKACDLWKTGTQTVFGEGKTSARIMFVGEQPGDREDIVGRPFVGPAGMLLDRALAEAGIDRDLVYVTNIVKHFKWARDERGKRRIHKKPRATEIHACRPWLEAELAAVKPDVLVCLGATAAHAILGNNFSVTRQRGEIVSSPLAKKIVATIHPSALLRMPAEKDRHAEMQRFVGDLQKVARLLQH